MVQMSELLDNLYSQENYLVSKKLLDATHLRHEALANNLANVETPGFKRRDLPKTFSVELRRAVDRKDFRRVKSLLPRSAEDRQAKPVRMDGNTVQLDEEMLAMNRNALNYEYLSGAVGGTITGGTAGVALLFAAAVAAASVTLSSLAAWRTFTSCSFSESVSL